MSRPYTSDLFVGAARIISRPAVPFVGAAGLWAPEHATVGAPPSPVAPKKICHVATNRFSRSDSKLNLLVYINSAPSIQNYKMFYFSNI